MAVLPINFYEQIIKSQNPTRDLGKKAYQQLFELGFVDAPFTVGGGGSSGSPSKGSANTPFPSSSSGGNNTPTPRKRK